MKILGYAYEADTHCIKHTTKRFADPATATDGEGNQVWPIYAGTSDAEGFYCSECVYAKVKAREARKNRKLWRDLAGW